MRTTSLAWLLGALIVSACGDKEPHATTKASGELDGVTQKVVAGSFADLMWVPAQAAPRAHATLSTKLMGTVTAVHVREGDLVRAGQVLLSVDARDLTAKGAQVEASIAEAEAMRRDAETSATRMRDLFANEAATRAQLDAAETGLARAEAAVRAARAARAEVNAARSYSVVRAPFNGLVTARMVDPGAFATPGAPLLRVEDARQLRVTGTASPQDVRRIRRGMQVQVRIEDHPASGKVEAVVPTAGSLYHVIVLVDNATHSHLPGTAASIALPQAVRSGIRIPAAAVKYVGDLTGVEVVQGATRTLRWIQLGEQQGNEIEVLAGLRAGEEVVVPRHSAGGM